MKLNYGDALKYQREHPNEKLASILYTLNVCDNEKLIENVADILGKKGVLLNSNTIKIKGYIFSSKTIEKREKCDIINNN